MKFLPTSTAARFCGDRLGTMSTSTMFSMRVLDVPVERRLVEDRRGGMLVLVAPAPDLDDSLHERDDELGMLLGHVGGTGVDGRQVARLQGPVGVPGQVLDRLELAGGFLQVLEVPALRVDRIDLAIQQRGFERRTERSCL